MKKNMLFLIWLILPLLTNAQNSPINYLFEQEEFSTALDHNEESFSSTQRVLDSIVTTHFDLGNEYLFEKWGWEHDELARDIEFFIYRWDNINNTLFHSSQRDYTFSSDKRVSLNMRADDALTPLSLSSKYTELLDNNDDFTEGHYELWDEVQELWEPRSKYITTLQSDTLVVRINYSWDQDLLAYQLSGKTEYRTYEDFRSTQLFKVDNDGNFVPNYFLENTYNPIANYLELYEQIKYFPDTDEWKVITRDRWVYDFTNLKGYRTEASDWHALSNGEFIVHDSTTFEMDANYKRTSGKGYIPVSNSLDNFVHLYNYEYDFSSNEFLLIEYIDQKMGVNFEPYEVIKYYYSEIEVSTTDPTLINQEAINIQFPNPAQRHDQLVISKLPEGISSAQLWVIDQSGRLMQQQNVRVGESYDMQDLGVTGTGLFFVTLFVEGGQRT